ncbi:M24 family metallopeptidase, partial [Flavonifractor sp. DFI.6.63]|uniref:M24 family metallopeptidase n=1 Tax=Flavonifractor sp. DFI.6.63 TaxID=2963704 RepID=UPI00210DA16F
EGFLRARGAGDSLVLIRAEKPHTFITRAQNKPIRPNEVFVYSCEMAGPGGYWTQMVRPIFLERGGAPEAYEVLQVIREALAAGEAAARPGNRICDVDEA